MSTNQQPHLYRQHLADTMTETILTEQPEKPARPGFLMLYLTNHIRAALTSLGQLYRAPFASLMTMIVIAIALTLPSALFALLQNVKTLSQNINSESQISVYLNQAVTSDQAQTLIQQLQKIPGIAAAKYISPEQGLAQLQQQMNLQNALAQLTTNPLPGVILIQPDANNQTPAALQTLVQQLKSNNKIGSVQLDMQWIQRLYALIDLGRHLVYALGCLLGFGILFIIGNTISLSLQKHRREIEIFKLVGATNAFVRRPFLYTGILLSLGGGIMAWILVAILLWSLSIPVAHLANLYGSQFTLHNLNFAAAAVLIFGSILLGLIGAWLAVNKHLRAI